jgi:hypothetical protein
MFRARQQLGWRLSLLMAVGFGASSGEVRDPVTLVGWVVQVPVIAALARNSPSARPRARRVPLNSFGAVGPVPVVGSTAPRGAVRGP